MFFAFGKLIESMGCDFDVKYKYNKKYMTTFKKFFILSLLVKTALFWEINK
jgi:hypothetical protein